MRLWKQQTTGQNKKSLLKNLFFILQEMEGKIVYNKMRIQLLTSNYTMLDPLNLTINHIGSYYPRCFLSTYYCFFALCKQQAHSALRKQSQISTIK